MSLEWKPRKAFLLAIRLGSPIREEPALISVTMNQYDTLEAAQAGKARFDNECIILETTVWEQVEVAESQSH